MSWTEEKLDALREIVASPERPTAAQIGAMLGVTKNTIIGQCRRNGIKLPNPQFNTMPRDASTKPRRKLNKLTRMMWGDNIPDHIAFSAKPEPPRISATSVGLLALQFFHCRWPTDEVGRDGFAMFCGAPSASGPYCTFHGFKAYRTKDQLRRDAVAHRKMREEQTVS